MRDWTANTFPYLFTIFECFSLCIDIGVFINEEQWKVILSVVC